VKIESDIFFLQNKPLYLQDDIKPTDSRQDWLYVIHYKCFTIFYTIVKKSSADYNKQYSSIKNTP